MSLCAATQSKSELSVAAYEHLRRLVLAGTVFSSHFGLILLRREGLAAWISRGATWSAPLDPAAQPEPRAAAPNLPDQIHASVVQVLASLALRGRGETNS